MHRFIVCLLLFVSAFEIGQAAENTSQLPIVDLVYTVHQATLNSSSSYPYYNFSNIRYGQPPTGDLRFQAPRTPDGIENKTVNNGQQGVICAQGSQVWYEVSEAVVPTPDPRTSEDCLFLDVIVPTAIYNSSSAYANGTPKSKGSPVLIWLYGGGYQAGDKTVNTPAGLVSASKAHEGVIFVAMNYLFGFLAGTDGITPNAGLLDQRLAMDWVQKYIRHFGGDPNNVTIMGESAGGGSVLYHITAYAGTRAPFQKAIMSSPATDILLEPAQQHKDVYEAVLAETSVVTGSNVTSVKQLQAMSFADLYATNYKFNSNASYGSYPFRPGPAGSNDIVPDFASRLLSEGRFDHNVTVLVGHNSHEGLLFASPFLNTSAEYIAALKAIIPSASDEVITFVSKYVDPDNLNGTHGYTNQTGRFAVTTGNIEKACNARFTNLAFDLKIYSYVFSVSPGFHGQDLLYTFWDGPSAETNNTLAQMWQNYLLAFATTGNPNFESLPHWPIYGQENEVLNMNDSGVTPEVDPWANEACAYWFTTPYA